MGLGTGWLVLLGLNAACAAADVRPNRPTHPQSSSERALVELPEVVAGSEQADLSPPPVDTAVGAENPARAESSAVTICGCKPADELCAMNCIRLTSSPPASPNSTAFDHGAASTQMKIAASIARSHCARSGGPVGSARVILQFANTGRVTSASIGSPYADTDTGSCVVRVFRQAVIPAFEGSPVAVSKSINIPSAETQARQN